MTVTATHCSFSKKNGPFPCVKFSVPQMRQFLLFYLPAKIKISFIWKADFFCQKYHLLEVDRRPPLRKCIGWSYSLSVRVKLIICQIRHELRVTIHERILVVKKFRWRTHSYKSFESFVQIYSLSCCFITKKKNILKFQDNKQLKYTTFVVSILVFESY